MTNLIKKKKTYDKQSISEFQYANDTHNQISYSKCLFQIKQKIPLILYPLAAIFYRLRNNKRYFVPNVFHILKNVNDNIEIN